MEPRVDPDILQQVRALLVRDLKLPPDRPLPEEMPLFGSDIDLDSLDMLLLVTSLERQFGVRIANRAVGQEVFTSVGSLAQYVQLNRATANSPVAATAATPTDWLSRLPHGPAFRFVSVVNEVRPGELARGCWNLAGSEPFFAAHFPGNPIVPGVLIAEALAQLSGLAGPAADQSPAKLAHVDVRFLQPVAPPASIELLTRFAGAIGSLQNFQVTARVGAADVAQGTIALARQTRDAAP
jgi:3-hydroxyacyl-[acyl-carrier-protein] dehydratase